MMPNDLAIPIVFPDYMARSDEINTNIPSGHAGILIVNGADGTTAYYEYGRYDPPLNRGLVRRQHIPNAARGAAIGVRALKPALRRLSTLCGHGGRLRLAWIELGAGSFGLMQTYADGRLAQNGIPTRPPYEIASNNCCTFARDVAAAGGASVGMSAGVLPFLLQGTIFPHVAELAGSLALTMSSPIPNAFMNQLQQAFPGLEFRPTDTWTSEGRTSLDVS